MIILAGKNKNLGWRYFANIFDYLIFLILIFLYVFLVGEQQESGAYRVTGLKAFVIPCIWFIYFPVCEATIGQTIGKKIFRLFVVDLNGKSPSIVQTFLRRMLDVFEMAFLGIPSLLAINYSAKNQRIGDLIAGTIVIRTDATCKHCGLALELTPKEVIQNTFTCPGCHQVN